MFHFWIYQMCLKLAYTRDNLVKRVSMTQVVKSVHDEHQVWKTDPRISKRTTLHELHMMKLIKYTVKVMLNKISAWPNTWAKLLVVRILVLKALNNHYKRHWTWISQLHECLVLAKIVHNWSNCSWTRRVTQHEGHPRTLNEAESRSPSTHHLIRWMSKVLDCLRTMARDHSTMYPRQMMHHCSSSILIVWNSHHTKVSYTLRGLNKNAHLSTTSKCVQR